MRVDVDSWDEVREAREALGGDFSVRSETDADRSPDGASAQPASPKRIAAGVSGLTPHDRSLLEQFIEAGSRGVLTMKLSAAIGAQGKGVRPALDRWTRRIGLVTEENATAFEPVKRYDGRGFKMLDHYIRAANQMLGR
jgi:hypothetical protein